MLFGHEDKVKSFEKLAKQDELHHAYLFYGDPEIGKATFARSLGRRLETGAWDDAGRALADTLFVLPPEGKKSLGIEEIREAKRFVWQSPFNSPRRLVIIDNAHLLTSEAQSAMLKIVEEPPRHALIICIVTELSVLMDTLLSRLVKVYFKRLERGKIADILKEKFGISEAKSQALAADSFGRIGRALRQKEGVQPADSENISEYLGREIREIRKRGVFGNSKKLAVLLAREAELARYNTNPPLQKKAIQELLCTNL